VNGNMKQWKYKKIVNIWGENQKIKVLGKKKDRRSAG